MPAATPLHILRARLLEEQATVAVAQQALAAATARVHNPSASLWRARLEEIEAQKAALIRQMEEDKKAATEARTRADQCAERRKQIAALLKDLDPTPQERVIDK